MPFVEGDSTQVARPVRPVSLTGAVADLDARQRQDDRALVPRVVSASASSSSANGQQSYSDVDPGDTVSLSWTPPGSGTVAVLVTLTVTTYTYSGSAVLTVADGAWPTITFAPGSFPVTAMTLWPAGTALPITATNDPGSSGAPNFTISYAVIG